MILSIFNQSNGRMVNKKIYLYWADQRERGSFLFNSEKIINACNEKIFEDAEQFLSQQCLALRNHWGNGTI